MEVGCWYVLLTHEVHTIRPHHMKHDFILAGEGAPAAEASYDRVESKESTDTRAARCTS
jgi:hypothetical protein